MWIPAYAGMTFLLHCHACKSGHPFILLSYSSNQSSNKINKKDKQKCLSFEINNKYLFLFGDVLSFMQEVY